LPGLAVSDDVPPSLKPGDRVAYTPLNGEQQLGVVIKVQNSASPNVLVAFDRFVWSTFKHSNLARFTRITTAFDADVVREVVREQSGGQGVHSYFSGPMKVSGDTTWTLFFNYTVGDLELTDAEPSGPATRGARKPLHVESGIPSLCCGDTVSFAARAPYELLGKQAQGDISNIDLPMASSALLVGHLIAIRHGDNSKVQRDRYSVVLVTAGSSEVLAVCKWGGLMLVVAETSPADASALAASAQDARLRFELVLSTATADEQTPGDIRGAFSRPKLKHVGSVGAAV